MRILAISVAGLLAAAAPAVADPREDLQAKGEQLAKEGRFGEAIEQFKAADRIQPRASHACLIALAYIRREQWPQAELFLTSCHKRANAGDPLPDWVPEAEKQLKDRLASANVVEVSISVTPPTAQARITVSSFAPDEVFEPQTIHLPLGTHVIFAKANGFPEKQSTIELKDKTPQHVVIDLGAQAGASSGTGDRIVVQPPPPATRSPSRVGLYLMIGGGIVGVAGVVSHLNMANKRSTLEDAPDNAAYDEALGPFERSRTVTIVCYAVSAGLLVTGYLLDRNAKKETAMTVGAAPLPEGGAFVSLGWSR